MCLLYIYLFVIKCNQTTFLIDETLQSELSKKIYLPEYVSVHIIQVISF